MEHLKFFDWEGMKSLEGKTVEEQVILMMDCFNDGIKEISAIPILAHQGQKIAGYDPVMAGQAPVVLVTSDTPKMPDRGYELIFDEVNMRQAAVDSFDMLDISGGVTFYQQEPGEEAKLSKLPKGALTPVSMLRFTGGFAILDDWLRFNKFYKIDQLTNDTVRAWFKKKATLAYSLITGLAGIDQAFDTDLVTTINKACGNILVDLDAAGYDVDENEQFVILCNPLLKDTIGYAIAANYMNPNANNKKLVHSIKSVVSTAKVPSTHIWVCVPGGKCQKGEWDDFHARPVQRNEKVAGADHVWTGAYNFALGEKKQFKKCALSA
jgi:hypothetical protein